MLLQTCTACPFARRFKQEYLTALGHDIQRVPCADFSIHILIPSFTNPMMPELNPSEQGCLPEFIYWAFKF
jgi:hypothetical protein